MITYNARIAYNSSYTYNGVATILGGTVHAISGVLLDVIPITGTLDDLF